MIYLPEAKKTREDAKKMANRNIIKKIQEKFQCIFETTKKKFNGTLYNLSKQLNNSNLMLAVNN